MMVVSARSHAISPAELATIANRVVNSLSMLQTLQVDERKEIVGKAIEFIEMAAHGDQIMKTGQLRANASDSLRNYGWLTRAFSLSSPNSKVLSTEDFTNELEELHNTLADIWGGKPISKEKIDGIKELFKFLRKIALGIDTLPTDKVIVR